MAGGVVKYEKEKIILIEYLENIPFSVFTEYLTYDFELYNNDWLMFYNSGGGKNWKEKNFQKIIEYEQHYCEPTVWKIWVDKDYVLTQIQTGVEFLKTPLMLPVWCDATEKYNNPFIVGEEVMEIYDCTECNKFFNEDGCPQHGYKEVL